MKKIILLMLLLASTVINAQQFDKVLVDGDLKLTAAKFKQRGWIIYSVKENTIVLKGTGNTYDDVELILFGTPKTKKVYKAVIYLPKVVEWTDIKIQYDSFVESMTSKLGVPDSHYEYFKDPYYLGDGYEEQAVKANKAEYVTFWLDRSNLNLSVKISEYMQLQISYENDRNVELYIKERKANLSTNF